MKWDLASLAPPPSGPAVAARARGCAERWRGRVAGLGPRDLARLLTELGHVQAGLTHLVSYASLHQALDVFGDEGAELALAAGSAADDVDRAVSFFEAEWQALTEDRVADLLTDPALAPYRHLLHTVRAARSHLLPAAQEEALAAREPLAQAWALLHDRLRAPLDEAWGDLAHADRDVRKPAYDVLVRGLEPHAASLALAYDALVGDRLAVDRLRRLPGPRALSDFDNHLDPAAVDGMLAEIEAQRGLAQRWFTYKARALGGESLSPWDERAPLLAADRIDLPTAVDTVLAAFARISPAFAWTARRIVVEGRVDAVPRAGRVSRTFSLPVPSERTCFVLVGFDGRPADVLDLAHELGHAVAFTLAAEAQPTLVFDAPTALGEVPACFAELAVLGLLATEGDPARAARAAEHWVDRCVTTVFRQALITSFEQSAYDLRREGRVLDAALLGDLWQRAHRDCYGGSLTLGRLHRLGWMCIPHLFHSRFYNYAYAFAGLSALGLHEVRGRDTAAFGRNFVAFLRTGGSAPPHEQLARLGLRIDAQGTWRSALDALRGRLDALTDPRTDSRPLHRSEA
ncbi:M3 family oligoendopeptidase [Streptomyces violascens]|uniref:M3 family oligoendopeptidase n=1 Tax=Streptomyces violascens TaxID=67381 RepID=UPI0037874E6F